MHYISLWEMAEIGQRLNRSVNVRPELRGYAMQAVPPDPQRGTLSVSDLASTLCTTHRDIYLAKVKRIKSKSKERPWEAEEGIIIHSLLQEIHRQARKILPSKGTELNTQSLLRRLRAFGKKRKNELLARYKNEQRFAGQQWNAIDRHLDNIIFFEALLICSLLNYKASGKTVLATGTDINPIQEFEQLFGFSAIEHRLSAPFLGLTEPVTPDFLYAHRAIGDIKTGAFHEDTFELTCVAYALAYEAETKRDIDFGIILHVGKSSKHPFPVYQGSRLYEINDLARTKFVFIRDQKLRVLEQQQIEPPVQPDEPRCKPCRFYSRCWEKQRNA